MEPPLDGRVDRRMLVRASLCAMVIVLMTAGTTVAAVLLQVDDVVEIVQHGQPPIPEVRSVLDDVETGSPQNLLLLGSDRRYADAGTEGEVNSDTIILLRLNPDAPSTTALSIPRDLQVSIPGYGVDKINAAYNHGGPVLAARTVRDLLGIKIHHVFVTTFTAFSRAVDFIGCVYTDVDHRYLVPPEAQYAEIDLRPGYQKLCGEDALSFVRFRHADDDLVRGARQQAFLRAAAIQAEASGLSRRVKDLVRLLARYTQTDVRSRSALLRLLKLGVLSIGKPVEQVRFPAELPKDSKDPYVYADAYDVSRAVRRFLDPPARTRSIRAPERSRRKGRSSSGDLVPAPGQRLEGRALRRRLGFPVYHLSSLPASARPSTLDSPRAYSLKDDSGRRHGAYRYVFNTGRGAGEYFGLQGMTWSDPPLLSEATDTTRIGGRTAQVATTGGRIVWIAWRRGRSVHWISNTLTRALTNRQMLGLAGAARVAR